MPEDENRNGSSVEQLRNLLDNSWVMKVVCDATVAFMMATIGGVCSGLLGSCARVIDARSPSRWFSEK